MNRLHTCTGGFVATRRTFQILGSDLDRRSLTLLFQETSDSALLRSVGSSCDRGTAIADPLQSYKYKAERNPMLKLELDHEVMRDNAQTPAKEE